MTIGSGAGAGPGMPGLHSAASVDDRTVERPVTVTAIIVTYESRAHIAEALASLDQALDRPGIAGSVIVVDNASTDGTAAWLEAERPGIRLIRAPTNEGFGRACNRAFDLADGDVWLLMNPDARLDADTVDVLVHELRRDDRLAAVSATLAEPGEAESAGMLPSARSGAGHFLFVNRMGFVGRRGSWRGVQIRRQGTGRVTPVEWASAAVLAVRPVAIRAVEGFDPAFFLYGEDIDLCARLGAAGWTVALSTETRARHAIGASSDPRSTRWLDGLDQAMVRIGRGRGDRFGFFGAAAIGLLVRAAAARCRVRRAGRQERLLPGARHAAVLAGRVLTGR